MLLWPSTCFAIGKLITLAKILVQKLCLNQCGEIFSSNLLSCTARFTIRNNVVYPRGFFSPYWSYCSILKNKKDVSRLSKSVLSHIAVRYSNNASLTSSNIGITLSFPPLPMTSTTSLSWWFFLKLPHFSSNTSDDLMPHRNKICPSNRFLAIYWSRYRLERTIFGKREARYLASPSLSSR